MTESNKTPYPSKKGANFSKTIHSRNPQIRLNTKKACLTREL